MAQCLSRPLKNRSSGPYIRGTADGKIVIAYLQGDPTKEASQLIACTNAKLTSLLLRVPGLAAPLLQAKACQ